MRLSRSMCVVVWSTLAILGASGAIWLVIGWLAPSGDPEPQHAAWQAFWMRVHGGSAMVALLVLGALLPMHVVPSWRLGRNRASGVAIIVMLTTLIVSAYGLYYAGDDHWRSLLSNTHSVVGLGSPLLLGLHLWLGRRARTWERRA